MIIPFPNYLKLNTGVFYGCRKFDSVDDVLENPNPCRSGEHGRVPGSVWPRMGTAVARGVPEASMRRPKLTPGQMEILADYDAQMAARAALERRIAVLSSYLEDVEGDCDKGLVKLLKRTDLDTDERAAVMDALDSILHGQTARARGTRNYRRA